VGNWSEETTVRTKEMKRRKRKKRIRKKKKKEKKEKKKAEIKILRAKKRGGDWRAHALIKAVEYKNRQKRGNIYRIKYPEWERESATGKEECSLHRSEKKYLGPVSLRDTVMTTVTTR